MSFTDSGDTQTIAEILSQMIKGGDVILCSFAVLLSSFSCFARENNKGVLYSLLLVGVAETALYVIFKLNSNSEIFHLPLAVAVSLLSVGISIFVSYMNQKKLGEIQPMDPEEDKETDYMSQKKLGEIQLTEELVEPIENAEEVGQK